MLCGMGILCIFCLMSNRTYTQDTSIVPAEATIALGLLRRGYASRTDPCFQATYSLLMLVI